MEIKQQIIDMKLKQNKSWKEVCEFAEQNGIKKERARSWVRHSPGYKQPPESIETITNKIKSDLHKEQDKKALCDRYKITKRVLTAILEDLKEDGFLISEEGDRLRLCKDIVPQENKLTRDWTGQKIIKVGLCGDTHSGSKYAQITYLHKYYDICQQEGITEVYHTGDITEGEEMRAGHKYECYSQGADEHKKEVVQNYPSRPGIKTYYITGNHDHSLIKRAGYDIGVAIAAERKDMEYLGQSSAVINLTPNCTLEVRHPLDGTAYALSYKTQKMIDAMQGGEKPNILAIGHYHKAEYLFYRNIHAFQTGCFLAQTPWMKGKQIAAHVGGWIIEVHVDEKGTVTRCKGEFIPFYKMIKDDWQNWR